MKHFITSLPGQQMSCQTKLAEWHEKYSRSLSHLDWLAKFLDFNPLKNMWDYLEQQAKRFGQHPRNLIELCNLLEREGMKIGDTYIPNFIDFMPRQVAAVFQV